MANVTNINVIKALEAKIKEKLGNNARVEVITGYTAAYALAVHEKRGMVSKGKQRANGRGRYWDPQGRARAGFLLDVAREKQKEIAKTAQKAIKGKHNLEQAVVEGGLLLQRESQLACPVDTGNLKASAFTRVDKKQ